MKQIKKFSLIPFLMMIIILCVSLSRCKKENPFAIPSDPSGTTVTYPYMDYLENVVWKDDYDQWTYSNDNIERYGEIADVVGIPNKGTSGAIIFQAKKGTKLTAIEFTIDALVNITVKPFYTATSNFSSGRGIALVYDSQSTTLKAGESRAVRLEMDDLDKTYSDGTKVEFMEWDENTTDDQRKFALSATISYNGHPWNDFAFPYEMGDEIYKFSNLVFYFE